MRKCPHCGERTIKQFNKTIFVSKTINCSNCDSKIGLSRKGHTVINLVYVIILISLIIINSIVELDKTPYLIILLSSAFVVAVLYLFFLPYEIRQKEEL